MTSYKAELLEVSKNTVLEEKTHNLMVIDDIKRGLATVEHNSSAHMNLLDQLMYCQSNLRDIHEVLQGI